MKLIWPIKSIGKNGIYISQKFANVLILDRPYTFNGVTYPAGTNFYKAAFGMDGHNGIDIACPIGTPIYAPHDGTVTATYNAGGYGNYIRLKFEEDGFGWEVTLGHLNKILKTGTVKRGELIAQSGNSGTSTNPHLHYGLGQFKNGVLLNKNNGYKGSIDPAPFTKGEAMNQAKVVVSKNSPTVYVCYPIPSMEYLKDKSGLEGFSVPDPIPNTDSL